MRVSIYLPRCWRYLTEALSDVLDGGFVLELSPLEGKGFPRRFIGSVYVLK